MKYTKYEKGAIFAIICSILVICSTCSANLTEIKQVGSHIVSILCIMMAMLCLIFNEIKVLTDIEKSKKINNQQRK